MRRVANRSKYDELLSSMIREYKPKGPTEEHLVEEFAGIIWRKYRLKRAEVADHARALQRATDAQHYPATTKAALAHVTGEFIDNAATEILYFDQEERTATCESSQKRQVQLLDALKALDNSETGRPVLRRTCGLGLLLQTPQAPDFI
jgi:hypothetical protein